MLSYGGLTHSNISSLPGMEENTYSMVEQLKKKLSNPDSLVSLFLGIAVVTVIVVMIFNYIKERNATTGTQ